MPFNTYLAVRKLLDRLHDLIKQREIYGVNFTLARRKIKSLGRDNNILALQEYPRFAWIEKGLHKLETLLQFFLRLFC